MNSLDCEVTTTCPRCREEIFWTYSNPPQMPRYADDYDEQEWYCGECKEAVHFFELLAEWRSEGLESLREHRDFLRTYAAEQQKKKAA